MSHDKAGSFEIHIVSYNNTKLLDIPNIFEQLDITESQICLNEVTSFHDINSLEDAMRVFNHAVAWFEKTSQKGEMHIKLEYFIDLVHLNNPVFKHIEPYPDLPVCLSYDENYFIGGLGWDVHIDGLFDKNLQKLLIDKGWVYLSYLSEHSSQEFTTLTQHFLSKDKCSAAYKAMLEYLLQSGGFVGDIYYEEPVRYLISTK